MTPCALTSRHVVISKQVSAIRALGYNMCVIGRRPRDENHAVRFRQGAENRSRARDTQPIWGVSDEHASVGTPWFLEEDIGRSPLSDYMSLHPSLTHHRNINPFENKVWEIYFLWRSVFVHSLKFINYIWICMWVYNRKSEWRFYFRLNNYPIYPTPPLGQDMTQGQFLSGV